jgi:hypothetical protein
MAAQIYSNLSAVLGPRYKPRVLRGLNSSMVALRFLQVRKATSHQVHGVMEFDSSTAVAPVADGADAPAFSADTPVAYNSPFAIYPSAISIGGLAQALASRANNPSGLNNPFERQLENAGRAIGRKLNVHFYTGTGAASPQDLAGAAEVVKTTGTFQGIARATYADWRGVASLNGGTPRAVSAALLDAHLDAMYSASGRIPDIAFCSVAQWRAVANLFTTRDYNQAIDQGVKNITFKGGSPDVLMWGQTLLVKDKDCPAGLIYFFCRDHVWAESVDPAADPQNEGSEGFAIQGDPESQGDGSTGISVFVQKLGKKGWKYDAEVLCALQMHWEKPNTTGVLGDLS